MNKGSCLCGKITFEVKKLLPVIGHCHCTMCQKFHGAAFSTFVETKVDNVTFLTGKELLKAYQAENKTVRQFCNCCGSSLLFESTFNRKANTIEIALACFDELEHVKPDAHIYIASKAPWYEIDDNLPQFIGFRANR